MSTKQEDQMSPKISRRAALAIMELCIKAEVSVYQIHTKIPEVSGAHVIGAVEGMNTLDPKQAKLIYEYFLRRLPKVSMVNDDRDDNDSE